MELWAVPAALGASSACGLAALAIRRWWRARRQAVANQIVLLEDCRDALDGLVASTRDHAALPRDPVARAAYNAGMLDYRVQPLYDTLLIERWANGLHRAFQDYSGKSDREWSHYVCHGGSLSAPHAFIATGLVCRLTPCSRNEEVNLVSAEVARDRARLEAAIHVRFHVGIRDYLSVPLSLLKNGEQRWDERPILIPSQQDFFVEANIAGCENLNFRWELLIGLDGYLGTQDDQLERQRRAELEAERCAAGEYGPTW